MNLPLFISLVSIAINVCIFKRISKKYPHQYIMRFLYIYYILQIGIAAIFVIDDSNYVIWGTARAMKVIEILPVLSLCCTIIGLMIWFGLYCSRDSSKGMKTTSLVERINSIQAEDIIVLSRPFCIIFSLSFVFTLIPHVPYVLRVISLSFTFIPLFVGIYFNVLKSNQKKIWIAVIVINMLLNMVQGSRGYAIIPIALWTIGYLITKSQYPRFKMKVLVIAIFAVPVLSIFGKIQDYRDYYGRGMKISQETIGLMFDFVFNAPKLNSDKSALQGLSRFMNIGDLSILHATPSKVDYRGFEDMLEEFTQVYSLYGSEGSKQFDEIRGDLGYGSGVLTRYGFHVNAETSVGLGYLGDSYSRFGIIGVMLYFFIASWFISSLELKLMKKGRLPESARLVFLLFLMFTVLYTLYGNPYYALLKKLIYNGGLVMVVLLFLCKKQRLKR